MESELRVIPRYDVASFRGRTSDYCVSVFVINENGKLHRQLERMRGYSNLVDIVIADGGSTDGSVDHKLLESFDVNTLLVKKGEGKLGAQMRMAFAWALDRGYQGILTIDGNNKDDPDPLPLFIDHLRIGYDHIQGSRFIPGGVSENLPFNRWLGIKLLHAPLISLASNFRYTDTTNGFRGYSARFLSDLRVSLFREVFTGYELHYYLAIQAARLHYRVCELPVSRRYPASGPIPSKISPVSGNLKVIKCLFAACLGLYNPP